MPRGVYTRTEFHKSRCGFTKGHVVNKGRPSAIKGRTLSEEHKAKISKTSFKEGYVVSEETKAKISESHMGIKPTEETRKKMAESHLGQSPSNKGVPCSEESIEKMRRTKLGDELYEYREKHGYTIKDSKRFYSSSKWIKIRKLIYKRDNFICQECDTLCDKEKPLNRISCHHIDYNINNNDHSNLITLCQSCHMKTNQNREEWTDYFELVMLEKER